MVAVRLRYRWLAARPPEPLGNSLAQLVSPQVTRLVGRTPRVGKTAEAVVDLHRVGGEAEFAYLNEEAVMLVNQGMKVYFHFRFINLRGGAFHDRFHVGS